MIEEAALVLYVIGMGMLLIAGSILVTLLAVSLYRDDELRRKKELKELERNNGDL